jgi:iron complex transport system ATP-binding protein
MKPLLELSHVCFRYDGMFSLDDISMTVGQGDFLGILGPNGSGKSTLLRIIDGILKPHAGQILIGGKNLRDMKRKEIARRIALLPQESVFHFTFDCLEIVLQGRAPHLSTFRLGGKEDVEIAMDSMHLTDTADFVGRSINSLSGGERQRVLLARAIAQQSDILILDEPTANLDLRYQLDLARRLGEIHRERSMTIIIVSHDLNLVSACCSSLVLINKGRIFAQGSPEAVLTKEKIDALFNVSVVVDRNPLSGTPRIYPAYDTGGQKKCLREVGGKKERR